MLSKHFQQQLESAKHFAFVLLRQAEAIVSLQQTIHLCFQIKTL